MTTPPFKSLGLPTSRDTDLDAYVRDRGVPVLAAPVAPAKPKGEGLRVVSEPTRNRRVSVELPDYLAKELKKLAADRDCTIRFVILEALQKAGFEVGSDDFVEDGRRHT